MSRRVQIVAVILVFIVGLGLRDAQLIWAAQATERAVAAPVFDADRQTALVMGNGSPVLFAAGDVADCGKLQGLDQLTKGLRTALGLSSPALKPNQGMASTASLIEREPGALVLALGDLVYSRGEPRLFEECYEPTWGRFRDRTWPTPGNHDYGFPGALGYYDYWGFRAGPDRKGYYAIQLGSWLLVSLNSEVDARPGSPQDVWLRSRLESSTAGCVLAFFHKPAFSAGDRRGSENSRHLFARLAAGGASLVLAGHNHFYERTRPLDADGRPDETGVETFVVGTGGKSLTSSVAPAAFDETLLGNHYGVLRLELGDAGYEWAYLQAPDGEVLDSGTRTCRGA